jgi:hypothetical protein
MVLSKKLRCEVEMERREREEGGVHSNEIIMEVMNKT